ncbi:phage baseplate assembly protein V [Chitinasiproducens palmae]|uniref:Phage baseplate assembly protein V n=1 Tax=Chitinasiproducens palmae TaxID=1770053 RepID=A0A1H2PQH9_9BURK|nr:phage baseplate assembly protein V [Chitinasiproducens palmae]SDV49073.1 phage baseplate assembly protein V [Chitinasiproducens palmae]
MDPRERQDDLIEALQAASDGAQARIWTAFPGVVQSFDPTTQTATIQPSVRARFRDETGEVASVDLPLLTNCPVQFPAGGNCTLTFPLGPGDEALMVFSSRCIDAWWQGGGIEEQVEYRMHDLSDGFAIPGIRSVPRALPGLSATCTQLRSDDGSTFIELNPSTKAVRVVAPGGFEVDAPTSVFTGETVVQGLLTYAAGLAGSGGSHATATITGIVNVVGQIIANGKRVDDSHRHSGVEPGDGTSGAVT